MKLTRKTESKTKVEILNKSVDRVTRLRVTHLQLVRRYVEAHRMENPTIRQLALDALHGEIMRHAENNPDIFPK